MAGEGEAAALAAALRALEVDVDGALARGSLVVLRPGAREIAALVRAEAALARADGFAGLCVAAEMSALDGELLGREARRA